MKKSISILFVVLLILTCCKKQSASDNKTASNNHTTASGTDTALIHIWIADSAIQTGAPATVIYGMTYGIPGSYTTYRDTLKITPTVYDETHYSNGIITVGGSIPNWTTSGDSLFAGLHYKYSVNSGKLWTCMKSGSTIFQSWYHRK
jgi:hypothetical protein